MRRRASWVATLALAGLAFACGTDAVDAGAGGAGQSAGGAGNLAGASVAGGASSGAGAAGGAVAAGSGGGDNAMGGVGAGAGGAAAGGTSGSASGGAATSGAGGATGGNAGAGGGSASPFKGVANSACADLGRLTASWWYNWTLSPGSCKTNEFVPMIAGKSEKTSMAVQSALAQLKAAGYRTVLGFNEPNKSDQANLSVSQVIDMWPAMTADPEMRVGSPSTSADANAWFEDFMTQVEAKSLRVDFVTVHWYGWNAGSCNDAKELESHIVWAEKFKRPIWITEFGCMNQSNPSADVVQKFYAAAIEMLSRHPSVERYAWYPWNTNNELVASGNLTALGTAFGQAPSMR